MKNIDQHSTFNLMVVPIRDCFCLLTSEFEVGEENWCCWSCCLCVECDDIGVCEVDDEFDTMVLRNAICGPGNLLTAGTVCNLIVWLPALVEIGWPPEPGGPTLNNWYPLSVLTINAGAVCWLSDPNVIC